MQNIISILTEIRTLLSFNKEIFSLKEFALYAGISINTAYKYTSDRRLPFYRVGKMIYFRKEDVINFLTNHPVYSLSQIDAVSSNYRKY